MTRAWSIGALAMGTALAAACSDSAHPAGAPVGMAGHAGSGGKSGSGGGSAGELNAGSDSGGEDNLGGVGSGGESGSAGAGLGGASTGGSGGTALGGSGSPPLPPVGDPPICEHGAVFGAGAPLPLSGPGDDLLQAIAADEHTIAWRNGDEFFVADRSGVEFPFGAPLLVPGSADYDAVTLSDDGLRLIAVRKDLRVIEMVRESTKPFDEEHLSEGAFELFNGAIAADPTPGKELADAVLSADGESFFHSYFLDDVASGAAIQESRSVAGFWKLASADLGPLLYRADGARRVPTGVSSDSLTLFYRDEVEGDFRLAWRVNTEVPFDSSEVLNLESDVEAAAPNPLCTRVYYSAPGAAGLDIFVSDLSPP